jgi:hypothetical protein
MGHHRQHPFDLIELQHASQVRWPVVSPA